MNVANARNAAALAGEKQYQGPRCARGHSGFRYTHTGHCVQCRLAGLRVPRFFTDPSRVAALEKGRRYYKGSPCAKAAHVRRYVSSGRCVQCASDASRKHYEKKKQEEANAAGD